MKDRFRNLLQAVAKLHIFYDVKRHHRNVVSKLIVLGNVVISKISYAHARSLVMHSNERGECHLRTLVDRKRKHYNNAVDLVVHLHDRPILGTERTAPPSSAHVQLDDDPRAPIQQSVGEEFRQHDGV